MVQLDWMLLLVMIASLFQMLPKQPLPLHTLWGINSVEDFLSQQPQQGLEALFAVSIFPFPFAAYDSLNQAQAFIFSQPDTLQCSVSV